MILSIFWFQIAPHQYHLMTWFLLSVTMAQLEVDTILAIHLIAKANSGLNLMTNM